MFANSTIELLSVHQNCFVLSGGIARHWGPRDSWQEIIRNYSDLEVVARDTF